MVKLSHQKKQPMQKRLSEKEIANTFRRGESDAVTGKQSKGCKQTTLSEKTQKRTVRSNGSLKFESETKFKKRKVWSNGTVD